MRWSTLHHKTIETPEIDAFLRDIEAVCRHHGLSISTEDSQSAFLVGQLMETARHFHNALQPLESYVRFTDGTELIGAAAEAFLDNSK